jgi:hypothetical protein
VSEKESERKKETDDDEETFYPKFQIPPRIVRDSRDVERRLSEIKLRLVCSGTLICTQSIIRGKRIRRIYRNRASRGRITNDVDAKAVLLEDLQVVVHHLLGIIGHVEFLADEQRLPREDCGLRQSLEVVFFIRCVLIHNEERRFVRILGQCERCGATGELCGGVFWRSDGSCGLSE